MRPDARDGGSAMMALGVLRQAGVRDAASGFRQRRELSGGTTPTRERSALRENGDLRRRRGVERPEFIVPGLGDFGDRYFGTFGYSEGLWERD